MKISVVIPCYNERETIEEIIRSVRSSTIPDLELVVVDDASNDGTTAVLQGPVESKIDRLIVHEVNRGKGAALRSGFAAATGDIILV
jgi:glycosyltransferase involved in cell wall biosynthesis